MSHLDQKLFEDYIYILWLIKTNRYKYFYCLFRQIQPARCAYLGLSREVQQRNERTMHVNAQVTAVTTMMEVLGNGITGVLFVVFDGFTRFTSAALFMLLHFVVLSYAYLMNTRYNKNRIIEYGWKNVLKNIISRNKRSTNSAADPTADKTTIINNGPNQKCDELTTDKHNSISISVPNNPLKDLSNVVSTKQKDANDQENPEKKDIYIISNNLGLPKSPDVLLKLSNECQKEMFYESLRCEPTSSTKYQVADNENSLPYGLRRTETQTSETQTSIVRRRSEILTSLLSSLHEEEIFIKRLRILVELEEAYKNNKDLDTLTYNDEGSVIYQLPHFVGSVERKLSIRTDMIHKLQELASDNESYDEYYEQYLDMEENFLENGC